jgi:hypothetical protein
MLAIPSALRMQFEGRCTETFLVIKQIIENVSLWLYHHFMPRRSGLDASGILNYVIVRGMKNGQSSQKLLIDIIFRLG